VSAIERERVRERERERDRAWEEKKKRKLTLISSGLLQFREHSTHLVDNQSNYLTFKTIIFFLISL
jgi:hypothetical protein